MLDYINQVSNNASLYGHCLTSLPSALWSFATSDKLVTPYTEPDPGSARRIFFIYEMYTKTEYYPSGAFKGSHGGTNILLFKYTELFFRRVVGTCLAPAVSITLAPIGFAIKIIHDTFKQENKLASAPDVF